MPRGFAAIHPSIPRDRVTCSARCRRVATDSLDANKKVFHTKGTARLLLARSLLQDAAGQLELDVFRSLTRSSVNRGLKKSYCESVLATADLGKIGGTARYGHPHHLTGRLVGRFCWKNPPLAISRTGVELWRVSSRISSTPVRMRSNTENHSSSCSTLSGAGRCSQWK